MTEELISFETAKLAKEKGFDWECRMTAVEDTEHIYGTGNDNHNQYRNNVSIPTQSLLQKWLREEHNIQVYAWYDEDAAYQCLFEKMNMDIYDKFFHFQTYEEALERGLQEALKLIKT